MPKRALKLALLPLVFFLSSCDLFSTRTPDSPDIGNTFIWTPASTPPLLLANFKGTLEVLDATNHIKCFIGVKDSSTTGVNFIYHFAPRAGLDPSSLSIFDGWSVSSEQSYLTRLRSSLVNNPKLTVIISNEKYEQGDIHSARITFDYTILIPTQGSSSIPATITGSSIFETELVTTEQATKEWRVVQWSDYISSNPDMKTFSDLKVVMSL